MIMGRKVQANPNEITIINRKARWSLSMTGEIDIFKGVQ